MLLDFLRLLKTLLTIVQFLLKEYGFYQPQTSFRGKASMPYFKPGPLSEILIISSL